MERNGEAIGREEFDGVWDRVTAPMAAKAAPPTTPTVTQMPATLPTTRPLAGVGITPAALDREAESRRLENIMSRTNVTERECCEAAKQCRGTARETLRCIERSCRATIRDLSTQFYILTAECCCPGSIIAPVCCVREMLRRVCANEAETREMCLNAAETTQFPSLAMAYARTARACACRERAAERLLGRLGCGG